MYSLEKKAAARSKEAEGSLADELDQHNNNNDRERDTKERDAMKVAEKKARAERPKDAPSNEGKGGGVYLPPHKLKELQRAMKSDKKDAAFQRMHWDALKKSINGLINKVNTSNIKNIIPEVFSENLVRGRGLVCRSLMKAQMASPNFTHVYVALIAVINTKMPEIGELILKRYIMQFRRAYRRNDKIVCMACTKFLAHVVNQQVAHELLALQLLTLLLEKPTDDSVEVAVDFCKESGQVLTELTPRGTHAVFERFRAILHEGEIDKRVQYIIEGLFAVRKNGFSDYPSVVPELDLVELDDQITHELSLEEDHQIQRDLDVFHFDPEWEENEKQYLEIKKEILGDEATDEKEINEDDEDDDGTAAGGSGAGKKAAPEDVGAIGGQDLGNDAAGLAINDQTDADIINLRRQIYLTIMSSVDFEECAHKLMKIVLKPGQEGELCNMILECASQERTYMRFYGLLAERFCNIDKVYQETFDECFANHYATIHRFETNRLRNIAKLFAHILYTDALDWSVLAYIKLSEEETTSSSRIFIKILFRELSELMGLLKLKARLEDPFMAEHYQGLFPRDTPKNTRFSINFFTSIGLGGLTEALRTYLKNAPKQIMAQAAPEVKSDSDSSSDDDSDSDSDSDSSSGSDTSDDSDDDDKKKSKKSTSSSSSSKSSVKKERSSSRDRDRDDRKNKKRASSRSRSSDKSKSSSSRPVAATSSSSGTSSSSSSRRHASRSPKKEKDSTTSSTTSSSSSRRDRRSNERRDDRRDRRDRASVDRSITTSATPVKPERSTDDSKSSKPSSSSSSSSKTPSSTTSSSSSRRSIERASDGNGKTRGRGRSPSPRSSPSRSRSPPAAHRSSTKGSSTRGNSRDRSPKRRRRDDSP